MSIADENEYNFERGYYGTLPTIEKEFEYKKQNKIKTRTENFTQNEIIEDNLQKAPLDDALFLDVILKKQKNSKYLNDIIRLTDILERFRGCIINNCSIQEFNANVNLIDLHVRRMEKLYSGTADSHSKSYYMLQNISYLAKIQGNLKYDANFYAKYMPLNNSIYSKENILQKDRELIKELDNTIFILRQMQ